MGDEFVLPCYAGSDQPIRPGDRFTGLSRAGEWTVQRLVLDAGGWEVWDTQGTAWEPVELVFVGGRLVTLEIPVVPAEAHEDVKMLRAAGSAVADADQVRALHRWADWIEAALIDAGDL